MKLVRLVDAGQSGTTLGKFLEALMRGFEPDKITQLIGRLERSVAHCWKEGWTEETKNFVQGHLANLYAVCKTSGLKHTAKNIRDVMKEDFSGDDTHISKELHNVVGVLRRNICWEMETLEYFEISDPCDMELWRSDMPFGKTVHRAFKTSRYDIEQAAKCLATDRYTASVFHGLRVLESGLNALAMSMGISNPVDNDRSWGKVLRKIKDQIELREKSKEPIWKKRVPALWDAHGFLQAVKLAWRDDTMHIMDKYDGPEARRIYRALQSFMEHIAENVDSKGKFRKK